MHEYLILFAGAGFRVRMDPRPGFSRHLLLEAMLLSGLRDAASSKATGANDVIYAGEGFWLCSDPAGVAAFSDDWFDLTGFPPPKNTFRSRDARGLDWPLVREYGRIDRFLDRLLKAAFTEDIEGDEANQTNEKAMRRLFDAFDLVEEFDLHQVVALGDASGTTSAKLRLYLIGTGSPEHGRRAAFVLEMPTSTALAFSAQEHARLFVREILRERRVGMLLALAESSVPTHPERTWEN